MIPYTHSRTIASTLRPTFFHTTRSLILQNAIREYSLTSSTETPNIGPSQLISFSISAFPLPKPITFLLKENIITLSRHIQEQVFECSETVGPLQSNIGCGLRILTQESHSWEIYSFCFFPSPTQNSSTQKAATFSTKCQILVTLVSGFQSHPPSN